MSLFELADDGQRHPLEVADRQGRPYLRLRRGAAITADLVAELNDLIGNAGAQGQSAPAHAWTNVASIPIPTGLVHVGMWQPSTVADPRWITVAFVGDDLLDTADLTVAAALALSDTLRTAALR